MASEANVTVIGQSATFRGELSGEGDVQIDGSLDGSVHVPNARITVGATAKVRALLSAQDIVVLGYVEGELRATGRAELRSSATVIGDVFASRLSVEEPATVRGHVDSIEALEKNGNSTGAGAESTNSRGPQAWRATQTPAGNMSAGLAAVADTVATAQRPSGSADAETKSS